MNIFISQDNQSRILHSKFKIQNSKFLFALLLLSAYTSVYGNDGGTRARFGSKTNMGAVMAVTRQDAAQIGGYGLGLGVELFVQRMTSSGLLISLGAGTVTLNDAVLKSENKRNILFPTLNFKLGRTVLRTRDVWIAPYAGVHAFSVMAKTADQSGASYSERMLKGGYAFGVCLGIMINDPTFFYVETGIRHTIASSHKENINYHIILIGLIF